MMKIAASTEDGVHLTKGHFGDGKFFLIYEVSPKGFELIEKRENTSPEEEEHGSKAKAQGIASILKDVDALLGYQFGPNIMRIKEKFLPILSREPSVERAMEIIVRYYETIEREAKELKGNVVILDENGVRVVKIKNGEDF
jgi:predicted Fe-Mo cluster-binding NifX family protein